jgi:hypothetical protein
MACLLSAPVAAVIPRETVPAACHDVSEALRLAAKTAETLANIAFEEAPAFPRAGFLKPETFPSLRARFELCKGGIPSKSRIAGAYLHRLGWIKSARGIHEFL